MATPWRILIGCLGLMASMAGCQCCPLTDHYADAVDCIADHEHHFEGLYCPCYDLTRIGRPDWCHCGINHILCQCRCERCKPLPHITDTNAAAYYGINCPWNQGPAPSPDAPPARSSEPAELPEPPEVTPSDRTLEPVQDPPALRRDLDKDTVVPPGEESLDLPPETESETDDTSFRVKPAVDLWSLNR